MKMWRFYRLWILSTDRVTKQFNTYCKCKDKAFYSVYGKTETKMFFIIFSTKLGRF